MALSVREEGRAVIGKLCRVALAAACLVAVPAPPASGAITGPPQTIASGLSYPWEVVAMPDGRLLVTERTGRVRVIDASGNLLSQPAYAEVGEGCLGLAIHPNYATNKFVYLFNTYSDGGVVKNRIKRFVDNGTTLTFSATIFDGLPSDEANLGHDGGRMKFGPDGKLYVTTGDVHNPSTPQNLESLAGKILRLNAPGNSQDGTAPTDNPFPTGTNSKFVWSYGHRHPQGIDWDASGQLWETEHGPSGESYAGGGCCRDEVNKIDKGANYGWPTIMGDERQAGMRSPVVSSGDTVTWAPGGAAFGPDGELYVPGLISEHLRQLSINRDQVTRQREHFRGEFGRLRTATYAGGFLYLTTSNNTTDEKVLRVPIDSQPASPVRSKFSLRFPHGKLTLKLSADRRRIVRVGFSARMRCGSRGSYRLSGSGLSAGHPEAIRNDGRFRISLRIPEGRNSLGGKVGVRGRFVDNLPRGTIAVVKRDKFHGRCASGPLSWEAVDAGLREG